jgi:hypothetical protein
MPRGQGAGHDGERLSDLVLYEDPIEGTLSPTA